MTTTKEDRELEQPVIVQVVRRSEPEKGAQNASKLVWWLASLASLRHPWLSPQLGDIVVETTHRIGMARHGLGLLSSVGELLKIEDTKDEGRVYTIKTIEGTEQRWSNAHFAVIERPEHSKKAQGGE